MNRMEGLLTLFLLCFFINICGACEDINTCKYDNKFTSTEQFCSNYEKHLECRERKAVGCNATVQFLVKQTRLNSATYNKAPYNCGIKMPPDTVTGGRCEDPNTCVFSLADQTYDQICNTLEEYLECMESKVVGCNATMQYIVAQTRLNMVASYNKDPWNCTIGTSPNIANNACEDPDSCVLNSNGQSNDQVCKNVNDYLDCFEEKTKGCSETVKNNVKQTRDSTIAIYSEDPWNCEIDSGSLPAASLILLVILSVLHIVHF